MNKLQQPIKAALVGISGYGRCHLDTLLRLSEKGVVALVAATVINQGEEQETCEYLRGLGCRIYADFDSMLQKEKGTIDICCIPTGIALHCEMTVAALRAGFHVLVEKPAAAMIEDVQRMQRVRDETGKHVFVGFQNMYAVDLWKTKEIILSKRYGDLKRIKVLVFWPRPKSYYLRNNWAGKLIDHGVPIFDSPANNAMAHFVMMSLFFSGSEVEASAHLVDLESELLRAQRIESFDTISARAKTDTGVELVFNMTHSSETGSPPIVEIECEEGYFLWDEVGGTRVYRNGENEPDMTFPPYPDTRMVMLSSICDVLSEKPARTCSLDIAAEHTRFIGRIHESGMIQQVSEKYLRENKTERDVFTYIDGLAVAMERAHEAGLLLSELEEGERLFSDHGRVAISH